MTYIITRLHNGLYRLREERGQGLVEYALIIAIVSLGAVAALTFLKGTLTDLFSEMGSSVDGITVGGDSP